MLGHFQKCSWPSEGVTDVMRGAKKEEKKKVFIKYKQFGSLYLNHKTGYEYYRAIQQKCRITLCLSLPVPLKLKVFYKNKNF